MPQSLFNILIHLIWSTKDRHPRLEPGIREKTHAFLAGAVRQCDCEAYRVGGVADHVHLAVRLSRTLSVADLVMPLVPARMRASFTPRSRLLNCWDEFPRVARSEPDGPISQPSGEQCQPHLDTNSSSITSRPWVWQDSSWPTQQEARIFAP
jgi:REP element-mobilizing transposase RayT